MTKQPKWKVVPLTYPLPMRDWYQRENGLWAGRDWTQERKRVAQEALVKRVPA